MTDDSAVESAIEKDRELIVGSKEKGAGATLRAYMKLSGPGWLQSAITLGGGSLAGSLYLGVVGGYQMMWLQPLMMLLGIVMLSSIAYVTLSTGERPFRAINRHISPVLGWGWIIATLMANMVWAMPQFSLGTAALEQNLGMGALGANSKYIAVGILFVASAVVIWFYDAGNRGIRIFEIILKTMVGIIVVSFFLVVVVMSTGQTGLPWGKILAGFVPNLRILSEPAAGYTAFLEASGNAAFWLERIITTQRERMVTAAATAVGINMTFLLPYSMLRKGWNREFRGLASFDLATGLFIPFLIATSCVVIASASQFHASYDPGLVGEGPRTASTERLEGGYRKNLSACLSESVGKESVAAMSEEEKGAAMDALPEADRRLSAMLVSRDAFQLADALQDLTGPTVAQLVFGIGVLGMAISTIIILMLINGFTICEMFNASAKGWVHRVGSLLPGVSGALGFLLLWGDSKARFWLAVPTSVFGMVLLPIAYITFFFMMNNRDLLKDDMPRGGKRAVWNILMVLAIIAACIGSGWSIWAKLQWKGVAVVGAFIGLAIIVHVWRKLGQRGTAQ